MNRISWIVINGKHGHFLIIDQTLTPNQEHKDTGIFSNIKGEVGFKKPLMVTTIHQEFKLSKPFPIQPLPKSLFFFLIVSYFRGRIYRLI